MFDNTVGKYERCFNRYADFIWFENNQSTERDLSEPLP